MELFPQVSRLQRFEVKTIGRAEILNAPYNPRTITPENRAKLEASLGEFGLVQPLIWNKRSGNLVGGHRRLEIIDADAAGVDFSLTVSVVDLDDEREKALNILLNAQQLQGTFQADMLDALLQDLQGKLTLDVAAILRDAETKAAATLRKVAVPAPPKMAWVLVGLPLVRYGEIAPHIEAIALVAGTTVESTVKD